MNRKSEEELEDGALTRLQIYASIHPKVSQDFPIESRTKYKLMRL